MCSLADWPGTVPAGSSTKAEDVVGRGVITPIYAKEPVIDSRLAPKGAGGGLAAMIPPGMRAVAIRVNEVVGVAGFVVPGMRVDVLISGNRPGGANTLGHAHQDAAPEHRSAFRRTGFQEGRGRQTGHRAGGEPAGDARAGRRAQPGEQPDQHPAGPAESAGSRSGQDARHGGLLPVHRRAPAKPGRGRRRARGRARPGRRWSANRHRRQRKNAFVMEIISGKTKTETKFDHSGEGK